MNYFIYCRKSQEAEDRQVMSLESQASEIDRILNNRPDIKIIDRYEEAYSAKQPGRPLFSEMLERIQNGEAEGIIAWHPDRLARNSMDGGQIVYLLDQGKLKDLTFCSYSFENTPQGKFMLNIIFGYSKYYVDNLSQNVKRGIRTKIEKGWQPNRAPTGYLNCKETGTIKTDPHHFDMIRRMFDLLLSGNHSVPDIHHLIWENWGYTTPVTKTLGGKRLSRAALYRIFSNPFYAGYIRWNGKLHTGKHKAMLTRAEFSKAQELIRGSQTTRPKSYAFKYAGLFTCGACGLGVTVERKRKPSGRTYIYYHCTRVHRKPKCQQPSVEEKVLDQQVETVLERIYMKPVVADWLSKQLDASETECQELKQQAVAKLEKEVAKVRTQISNLTDLRIRELLDDVEFNTKRQHLEIELGTAEERYAKAATEAFTFEPVRALQILSTKAVYWYKQADDQAKRKLLKILCSNPILQDKKARLIAAKPFEEFLQILNCLHQRGDVNDVRTTNIIEKLAILATNPETIKIAREIKQFLNEIDPLALEDQTHHPMKK